MAKSQSALHNHSRPFRIEDFEYNNSFVADLMMHNWDELSFTGVTVCHFIINLCSLCVFLFSSKFRVLKSFVALWILLAMKIFLLIVLTSFLCYFDLKKGNVGFLHMGNKFRKTKQYEDSARVFKTNYKLSV